MKKISKLLALVGICSIALVGCAPKVSEDELVTGAALTQDQIKEQQSNKNNKDSINNLDDLSKKQDQAKQ